MRSMKPLLPLLGSLVVLVAVAAGALVLTGAGEDGPSYEVSVLFTTDATQSDIDATDGVLRAYDRNLSYLLQETFPPTGRATLRSNVSAFCDMVVRQIERVPGVGSATCGLATTPVPGSPDVPVSSTP
jgi:hypothetical protein